MNQKILDKKASLLKEIKDLENSRDRTAYRIDTNNSEYRVSLLGRIFIILFGVWHGFTAFLTGFIVVGLPVIFSLLFSNWEFCLFYFLWWVPAGIYYFLACCQFENSIEHKWMINPIALGINKTFIFLVFGDKNTIWERLTFEENIKRIKESFSNLKTLKSKVEIEFSKQILEKKEFLEELEARIREEELKELFDEKLKSGEL